jgi:hypothetical protein
MAEVDATTAATMAQPARKPTTFAGDALKVAFGASSSQLFSILAAPVLTPAGKGWRKTAGFEQGNRP